MRKNENQRARKTVANDFWTYVAMMRAGTCR